MKRQRDLRALLRWYPTSWRERYEDEYLVFLDDRLADAPPSVRFRMSVAWAGLRERCYGSGIVGTRSSVATQRRTGSLLVLSAWSVMIIGGAGLAKTAEHFSSALPPGSRTVARAAYDATAVAGAVGIVLVLAGVVVAIPGLVQFIQAKRGSELRRVLMLSSMASVALAVATFGLSQWAHHLSSAQRNGADDVYSGAFVALACLVVVTIGLWTRTSVAAGTRIHFTPRQLRWESAFAIGVSLSSVVVVAGASLWWLQMGLHAPWFLQGSASGAAASPWSTNVVASVLVLALGAALALWGASRVAVTFRPPGKREMSAQSTL